MSYSCVFRTKFEKTIVIFEISTLKFFKIQNFVQNKKISNMEPKKPFWGYFKGGISYLTQHPQNFQNEEIFKCFFLGTFRLQF